MKNKLIKRVLEIISFVLKTLNPILIRQLSSDADRHRYNTIYIDKTGASVPIEYQKQGITYIFYRYNTPENWLGGFVLNSISTFRYLMNFESQLCQSLLSKYNISQHDLSEVGCLWMHARRSFKERLWMYSILMIKAYQTGKGTLLAGSFEPGLAGIQRKVFRTTIYDGPINIQGKQGNLEMYIVKRPDLIRNGLATIWEALVNSKINKRKSLSIKEMHLPVPTKHTDLSKAA